MVCEPCEYEQKLWMGRGHDVNEVGLSVDWFISVWCSCLSRVGSTAGLSASCAMRYHMLGILDASFIIGTDTEDFLTLNKIFFLFIKQRSQRCLHCFLKIQPTVYHNASINHFLG